MSRLLFFCYEKDVNNKFLYTIKKLTNSSLSELVKKIENGDAFLEICLFENDHDINAEFVKQILDLVHYYSVPIRIYEFLEDDIHSKNEESIQYFLTTEERIRNALQSRKEREKLWDDIENELY